MLLKHYWRSEMPRGHYERKVIPIAHRLLAKCAVDKFGCWLWNGTTNQSGYGTIGLSRGKHGEKGIVHRVSFEIFRGAIPPDMDVCHECDTPQCFNPMHLFLGSRLDNMQDAVRKGRVQSGGRWKETHKGIGVGESNGSAKLNEDQVREIRRLASEGFRTRYIAEQFGICGSSVRLIVRREKWKHVK
jgi:hypothetical protein